jgi:hypothetical protein
LLCILCNASKESIASAIREGLRLYAQGHQGKIAHGRRQFRSANFALRHMRPHRSRFFGRQCLQRVESEVLLGNV